MKFAPREDTLTFGITMFRAVPKFLPLMVPMTPPGLNAPEAVIAAKDLEATVQGDAAVITRLMMSSALPVVTAAPSKLVSLMVLGDDFEATT